VAEVRALPPDWGVRGPYVPFAHPKLAGARLRWRAASGGSASAEIVLAPEPGNFVGQYVVDIRRIGETVRLDPFDRRLAELVAEMRPVDPISIERTAWRARVETDPDATDLAELRYLSIVARAFDAVARRLPDATRVFSATAGAAEADRIFAPAGMNAIDAVSRIEECARAAAAIDRGRIDELADFVGRVRVVAANSVWADAERVHQVELAAERAMREAKLHASFFDLLDTDPLTAVAGDGPRRFQRAALLSAWWLDGWTLPVATYGAVADDAAPEAIEKALRVVIRMTPVVPANTAFLPDRPGAGVAPHLAHCGPPRVSRSATVRANIDWLTGRPAQQVLEDSTRLRQVKA